MSICPLDCAIPEVRRQRVQREDWGWTLLGLYPYKCASCQTRFRRMPSSVGATVVMFAMLAVCYPLSYVVAQDYGDYWLIQQVYSPLNWVLSHVRDSGIARM